MMAAAQQRMAEIEAIRRPGAGLISLFTQRRDPNAQIPLPSGLAALLQKQNIPVSGNIPGGEVFMNPDQLTQEVFQDAIRGLSAQNIKALNADPTFRANLEAFGSLAGADPLRAIQGVRSALPTQAEILGIVQQ